MTLGARGGQHSVASFTAPLIHVCPRKPMLPWTVYSATTSHDAGQQKLVVSGPRIGRVDVIVAKLYCVDPVERKSRRHEEGERQLCSGKDAYIFDVYISPSGWGVAINFHRISDINATLSPLAVCIIASLPCRT